MSIETVLAGIPSLTDDERKAILAEVEQTNLQYQMLMELKRIRLALEIGIEEDTEGGS